jgi:imidazolonepropionase-like amidohydrolase
MHEAGLDWRQVLASLTSTPAARFGQGARKGRIAEGMDADLVVLARDPAAGIDAFADVRYTLIAGRVVYAAEAPQ